MSEELHIKKTDLNASNVYQYALLKNLKHSFIPYEYEETADELKIIYDITGLKSLNKFRTSGKKEKYTILIELIEIIRENAEIYFSIAPDNLFLNSRKRIKILKRDIKSEENQNNFEEICALAGFLLQRRYSYKDYKDGGMKLLLKNPNTKFVTECKNEDELYEKLVRLFEKEEKREADDFLRVYKRGYQAVRIMAILFLLISIFSTVLFFKEKFLISKPLETALYAQRAYLERDYVKVIDTLRPVSVLDMDAHEKYILAIAYIRSQSVDAFSSETKEMLTDRLAYNSDEKQLDYWIYLGRLDADSAIDIAQRLSDNQLLLYAYINKLEILSADTALSGDEKFKQIESIRENIKTLAQNLGIEYVPESSESSESIESSEQ